MKRHWTNYWVMTTIKLHASYAQIIAFLLIYTKFPGVPQDFSDHYWGWKAHGIAFSGSSAIIQEVKPVISIALWIS